MKNFKFYETVNMLTHFNILIFNILIFFHFILFHFLLDVIGLVTDDGSNEAKTCIMHSCTFNLN
jgi:hypothetical protein